MVDTLAPDAVVPLLRGGFGRTFLYQEECESTQRILGETFPEGAVAVCEVQTAGRGRLGRRWEAPRGTAILCSVLLRPPSLRRAPELSLVGGLAVAEAVEAVSTLPAALKWPNDVLLEGRKVAGILAEARGEVVVLGIGLNVNQRQDELPVKSRSRPVSLALAGGVARERAPLLADLLLRLERRYVEWLSEGLEPLLAEISARDALRGKEVSVEGVSGIARGIAADGRLELDTRNGIQRVASGEVSLDTL